MIEIRPINIEEVAQALSRIPKALEQASKLAMKPTLRDAKQKAVSLATQRYTAGNGIIKSAISLKNSGLSGSLKAAGRRNPLEKFQTSPGGRIKTRGRYIRAVVVRGQGELLKRAFRKTSSKSIFERIGSDRFPLRKLSSVSAAGMLSVSQVREPLTERMSDQFRINFLNAASKVLGV